MLRAYSQTFCDASEKHRRLNNLLPTDNDSVNREHTRIGS